MQSTLNMKTVVIPLVPRSPVIRMAMACVLLTVCCLSAEIAAEGPAGASQPATSESTRPSETTASADKGDGRVKEVSSSSSSPSRPGGSSSSSTSPDHSKVLKDAKRIDGMLPLYQKGNKLYAELDSSHYKSEFIVLISIARGMGRDPLYGGMTWGFGDDWVWTFRKIGERVHIVRKNVRFKATPHSPEATAMKYAYTDSVLFSVPITTKGPKGGDLVELTSVFMSDLPQISQILSGFVFSASKSNWAEIKGFSDNMELEVAATYASSGRMEIDSVADTRGVTINVHYSISKLKDTGYKPRLADDRIGYFLTVQKDYSLQGKEDRFRRYINRWHLEPADKGAEISTPKKPIVFWLENTIPFKYRSVVRAGILEWNKAFEKAGFYDAIEVRQQPDNADWDAEDINYNTFRWITSSAGFAMGPSRVNPRTGQILDADIIFDADFLQFWKREYETFTPRSIALMTGGPLDIESYQREQSDLPNPSSALLGCDRQQSMSRQLAIGNLAVAAAAAGATAESWDKDLERLTRQALKGTVMHEIGHTLGLRHNFKGSTMLELDEMNNTAETERTGLIASVMDYDAVNLASDRKKQGDYYTTTIGPYDVWAIEYGYKALSGSTDGDVEKLQEIASRSGEPHFAFATDEDTRGISPDPYSNRYDLGDDPIAFAKQRAAMVKKLVPKVVDSMTQEGADYAQARRAFNVLLASQGRSMFMAARMIGGVEINRSHKGDKGAPAPSVVVPAKKQREALALLQSEMFADGPFQFDPDMLNHLGASHWNHWGTSTPTRVDFPIHEFVLQWQERVLDHLLSPLTLQRLHDSELKVDADKDCFTTAELIESLTDDLFSELKDLKPGDYTNRKPAISSLRRNIQRVYMQRLAALALGQSAVPDDCQTLAYAQLVKLAEQLSEASKIKLDSYSAAHVMESASRVKKVIDSRMTETRF